MGTYRRPGKISDLGMEPDEVVDYYNRQHVYNLVAKVIRERLEVLIKEPGNARTEVLVIALAFAHKFKKDNSSFNHLAWLDRCSPDSDLYPLSELWEDD